MICCDEYPETGGNVMSRALVESWTDDSRNNNDMSAIMNAGVFKR